MTLPIPGVYRLTRDVPNPNKDGRSREWNKQKVFPQYEWVVVKLYGGVPDSAVEVCKLGGHISSYIVIHPATLAPGSAWFEFCEALEPMTGPETIFRNHAGYPGKRESYGILIRLMQAGKVSEQDVLDTYKAWMDEGE